MLALTLSTFAFTATLVALILSCRPSSYDDAWGTRR